MVSFTLIEVHSHVWDTVYPWCARASTCKVYAQGKQSSTLLSLLTIIKQPLIAEQTYPGHSGEWSGNQTEGGSRLHDRFGWGGSDYQSVSHSHMTSQVCLMSELFSTASDSAATHHSTSISRKLLILSNKMWQHCVNNVIFSFKILSWVSFDITLHEEFSITYSLHRWLLLVCI